MPGPRVAGVARPEALNPAPELVRLEIVRFAEPVLVTVSGSESVLPTTTLPKLAADGLTEI